MQNGLILVGEPMGLLIAQTEGSLDNVKGYDLAVAGAEFNVAVGAARLEHKVTYMTKLGDDPFGRLIVNVLKENNIGSEFVTFTKERPTGFMLKGSLLPKNGRPALCSKVEQASATRIYFTFAKTRQLPH